MKLAAFLIGLGVGCVLGSVAYTGYALANHALGADDDELTAAQCREEGERAVFLSGSNRHVERLYHFSDLYRQQHGRPKP